MAPEVICKDIKYSSGRQCVVMWGLVTLSVKGLGINILGFVGQEEKLRTLYRYLYNKRENKLPQTFY